MPLFDTHAHLDDEQFAARLDEVIQRAHDAGVTQLLAVATSSASSQICVALAERYFGVRASVGIHPNHVLEEPAEGWEQVRRLAAQAPVVALGETGLDRYWDRVPFDQQQDYFDRHLRLSQELDLPFIIHMRDCESDVLAMLREAASRGPLRGVMHSFTGSSDAAAECVALGLHISFAGMVTYPKSQALRDTAATIPADRILVETDAPYLSPHPHRSHRPNEPALVVHTAACLAQVRGVTLEQFSAETFRNAEALFAKPGLR